MIYILKRISLVRHVFQMAAIVVLFMPVIAWSQSLPAQDIVTADISETIAISENVVSPEVETAKQNGPVIFSEDNSGINVATSALFDAGGPVLIILSVMSIIGLTVLLVKLWQFFRLHLFQFQKRRDCNINIALQQWRQCEADSAMKTLSNIRNPIANVLRTAILLKQKDLDDVLVREEVLRVAGLQLRAVRSHLKIIEVIATLSPLLGLLGTVLGMIEAFKKLQNAGTAVDPALLSGGIWEALLTTAAGLIVAIPAVIALNWLEQCIENFKSNMEDAMTQVFTSCLYENAGGLVTQKNHQSSVIKRPALEHALDGDEIALAGN